MSMSDAKDLHADITKILLALQTLHEQNTAAASTNPTVDLEVNGGTF
jgi:hypothetical protein